MSTDKVITDRVSTAVAEIYGARVQPKPWGREVIFAAIEGRYVGKVIHVDAGHSLSCLNAVTFGPGDTILLPPGVIHRVQAITDIVFAECSTADQGWRHDIVRVSDAYGRAGTTAP